MPDNDPFDHGAFCREIEWYSKSENIGVTTPEPYNSNSIPHSTSSGGVGSGATTDSGFGWIVILLASSFCSFICISGVYAKMFGTPNLYGIGGIFVLTFLYGRTLSRVRNWSPQSLVFAMLHTLFFLTLCLGPIAIVLQLANSN